MQALDEIRAPLLQAVRKTMEASERPLWVTGHSLGGAIALLAAWRFQRAFIGAHEIVTFGAPMIGNAAADLRSTRRPLARPVGLLIPALG
jgi:putative lipase involved disintegration of autophagic bodies